MEFMKHGNFGGLLRKISEQDTWVRTGELWRIFYCLFRACVALAYPGRWNGGVDPNTGVEMIAPQEELVPVNNMSTTSGMIGRKTSLLALVKRQNLTILRFVSTIEPQRTFNSLPELQVFPFPHGVEAA